METGESLLQLWRNKGKGRVIWPYLGSSAFLCWGRLEAGASPEHLRASTHRRQPGCSGGASAREDQGRGGRGQRCPMLSSSSRWKPAVGTAGL